MQNEKGWLSRCLVFGFGLLLALSVQALPLVSNVVGAQRAGTKLVDITYDLTDAENATLSVTIRISQDAGATWDVPCTSLSGNGIGPEVTPGKGKSILWDAGADWDGQWSDQMLVEVTATIGGGQVIDPPPIEDISGKYLVIDLSAGPNAARYPVSSHDAVPGGPSPVAGWSDEYKTTKLVLRKIPAGTFMMGSPEGELGEHRAVETQHQVTLTKDFYVGVFEVTQKQWERVMGTWPSYFRNVDYRDTRPVEEIVFTDIRGGDAGLGWPANNAVDADSFMGRLRARTGLDFDLPTEAQWEYACRAGTTTALNSGKNLTDEIECPNVAEVGRYQYNGGEGGIGSPEVDTSGGTAKVGSYLPNQWGLYDMHGNVWEWCQDRGGEDYSPQPVTDPVGRADGNFRVQRGGGWRRDAFSCRSARRWWYATGNPGRGAEGGFRLAFTIADTASTAPTAEDDVYVTPVDTQLVVLAGEGVLANDTDPEGDPLTAILVTTPVNGTLTLNTDGSFTYTPNAAFTGVDTFTYKANDGTDDSNVATVTITVNALPVANDDSYTTNQGVTLNVPPPGVLANDTDPEGDPLTAVLVTTPVNGTLTLNSDGSFTYTPNATFHGIDAFTYKANDGKGDSNVATVTITVGGGAGR